MLIQCYNTGCQFQGNVFCQEKFTVENERPRSKIEQNKMNLGFNEIRKISELSLLSEPQIRIVIGSEIEFE